MATKDNVRLATFRLECQQAVETAKLNYLKNLGNKVNDPSTSQKTYWKITNRVMNKCRSPPPPPQKKIPPLLVNSIFILKCSEKVKLFNEYFTKQCKSIISSSILTSDHISIRSDEIISFTSPSNLSKYSGNFKIPRYVETR